MDAENTAAVRSNSVLARWFPEVGAGGFTSNDGTVEFFGRVQALLRREMHVLDFGGGRGAALHDDTSGFRRELRVLQGKCAKVVACDVDDAVMQNPGADESHVVQPDAPLPFADGTFDLIVSDFVFEHIADPALVSSELGRILRPGGWICARTPNKYSLISLVTRLIHNSRHSRVLGLAQPERKSIDVFPTVFKLNTKRDIAAWFGPDTFDNFTYRYEAEPSYYFNNRYVFALMLLVNRLSPPVIKSGLFVFLRKKQAA